MGRILRLSVISVWMLCRCLGAGAQVFETADTTGAAGRTAAPVVVADGFWNDWFLQMGLDMSLQNPYGYDFSKVFPNGKSFGLDLAAGKWFSPQVGIRAKLNWENALPLLENGHASWLAPFGKPGENRDKGGYIAVYGDVLLNIQNLLGTYRADRRWNASLYPRIGVNYNFGVSKGALLAGIGIMNTYRIDKRWSLYGDVAYVMCGSGFVGNNESGGTGTGSNSNGYFSIGIGAQLELGAESTENKERGVVTNGFWDNWFVQAGLDMGLINPYGCNFSKVVPKGTTMGLNAAVGKWFTPEFALRGRVEWDNGLIPNNSLEWVPPVDDPKQNRKEGGLAVVSLDALLSVTDIVRGYDPERKWHTSLFVRGGVITQFVTGSGSPLLGAGLEERYRLNDRISLAGEVGYQVTTSEGMGVSTTGMQVAAGTNGFFDVSLGVVVDLGSKKFEKRGGR